MRNKQPTSNFLRISLLTGGSDSHYVYGLVTSLVARGIYIDLIGSDELDLPVYQNHPQIRFLNLRGAANSDASIQQKVTRILRYYCKLIFYASSTHNKLFHILWNNKFEAFDRTILMLFYRLLGKKVVLTVHNVNTEKRDGHDSFLNRLSLKVQYLLCAHLFTHTEAMRLELIHDYGVQNANVMVIPFGINNAVPLTTLPTTEAKRSLGLNARHKTILFFGRITPYKGLDLLVSAFRSLHDEDDCYRLIIAGREDSCDAYWQPLRVDLSDDLAKGSIILRNHFIADEDIEVYFKAADVLALPYRKIYQSGVLFLALSFGLPVVAADVGSFRDAIVEGTNGAVFTPNSHSDLVQTLKAYFNSTLYHSLSERRGEIHTQTLKLHSWATVSELSACIYENLLHKPADTSRYSATLSENTSEITRS